MIIVLFRDPLQHAASLLRQHKNFLEIHRDDRFARQYMAGIGHYDFGENLRPVNFNQWLDRAGDRQATTIEFWLEYWFETYRHLVERDEIHLFCYEDLCTNPSESLARLADVLQPDDRAELLKLASRIQPRRPHPVTLESGVEGLLKKSRDLYQQLRSKADRKSND